MNVHVGRNDPCPCGSGRKYKHCCLRAQDAQEMAWRRLRGAEGRLIPELFRLALDAWGADGFHEAQRRFHQGCEPPADPTADAEFGSLFTTWFGLCFAPKTRRRAQERSAAQQWLDDPAHAADPDRRFLTEAVTRPVSFHHIVAVDPGRSIDLEDLLTGETCRVTERSASQTARRGGVLFARTITLDGVSIMIGCGSALIPPTFRLDVQNLRNALGPDRPLTPQQALALDDELRRAYLDIADRVANPAPPKLRNTDGEPIAPTTLHFELRCAPEEAFAALATLNATADRAEDLLDDAEHDRDGRLQSFRIDWTKAGNRLHASWDNTILGSVEVNGASLVATVNSAKRAGRLRRQIEKRLAGQALFVRSVEESVEAMLAEARENPPAPEDLPPPELAEVTATIMERHWNDWLDTPVPALAGETPRQAATTDAGRARLLALLDDFEWRADAGQAAPVARLRAELGL